MANQSPGTFEITDAGNGSINLAWPVFPGITPDSYNVYLNGALNQNVSARSCVISGLQGASYNGAVKTPALTYDVKIVAVKGGVEQAMCMDRLVTAQPTSVALKTPMRRPFPFPNTGPGG